MEDAGVRVGELENGDQVGNAVGVVVGCREGVVVVGSVVGADPVGWMEGTEVGAAATGAPVVVCSSR